MINAFLGKEQQERDKLGARPVLHTSVVGSHKVFGSGDFLENQESEEDSSQCLLSAEVLTYLKTHQVMCGCQSCGETALR